MKNFFSILGGMGTLATESFVRILNSRTPAKVDQEYLNYLLVNHATVPDRTAYILDATLESPIVALKEDIHQVAQMNPHFFVLTCNTAHSFYDELQAVTEIPILHMPRIAATQVGKKFDQPNRKTKVIILATRGTINSGVYTKEFPSDRYEVMVPDDHLQQKIMDLIYRDVKNHHFFNKELYQDILQTAIEDYSCDVAVLGCTELSLMQELTDSDYPVIDAQSELADETIRQALAFRK